MTMLPKNPRANASLIDLTRCYAASDKQRAVSRRTQALLAAAGMAEPERRWYVAAVNADEQVSRSLALSDVGFWTPYVQIKVARRGKMKGERRTQARLAMPGYIFVKVAATQDAWSGLLTIKGVTGILGASGRPLAVPDATVELLRSYIDGDPQAAKTVINAVAKADKVIVKDGPFCSFPGVIESLDQETGRAIVEILVFGRITPVHLELAQLSKL